MKFLQNVFPSTQILFKAAFKGCLTFGDGAVGLNLHNEFAF